VVGHPDAQPLRQLLPRKARQIVGPDRPRYVIISCSIGWLGST
jgi:hypothetical protein